MIYDGKVYRNLEGQVAYLTEYLNANAVAAELGIKVVGQADNVSDIPEGEYGYGDAYMIGTEPPYTMYIWTRANGMHPEDYWFNVGTFPAPGPQGEIGLGIDDVVSEMLLAYQNSSATYDSTNGFYEVQINGTKTTTLSDNSTYSAPVELNIPIQTDGQVVIETGHSDNADINTVRIGLDRNLNNTYVPQRMAPSGDRNYPYVYGANAPYSYNVDTLVPCPIKLIKSNVVMARGDNTTYQSDEYNTVLGKENVIGEQTRPGGYGNAYSCTENLVFGGKNKVNLAVQDSSTFGYRNIAGANQAFTAGYKNENYGSESIVIGGQNFLDGNTTVDTTPDPDMGGYDGRSSTTKYMAVFGNKNSIQHTNTSSVIGGYNNKVNTDGKWNFVIGANHNLGKHNACVNALDYGNTTGDYVEDSTLIGYGHRIYGGTSNSWVYAANMIGHDNTNLDGNGNTISDIVLLGSNLKPSQQGCTVIGKFNNPTVYDVFEIGNGMANDNRSNIFAVADDPLDGPVLQLG